MRSIFSWFAVASAAIVAADCVHEKLDRLPAGWTHLRDAAQDEPLVLRVALPNQNVDEFEQRVYDVSTPGHKLYGQHLEGDEVKAFLKPLEESHTAVMKWLQVQHSGATEFVNLSSLKLTSNVKTFNTSQIVSDGEWISLRTTVGKANEMLKTKFSWFHNKQRAETKLRTFGYSVPSHLTEHVDFVHPTTRFPSGRELRSSIHIGGKSKLEKAKAVHAFDAWKKSVGGSVFATAPPDAVCNQTITPQCLLKLYNVHYGAKASNGNKVSFASFLNQSARYTDLDLFETEIASYAMGESFKVVLFNGATNDQSSLNDSTEANLDDQYITGVSYPTPVTEFITAGCGPLVPDPNEPAGACDDEPYLPFLRGILALQNSQLPQTLSVSYGDDEQAWPENLARRVCQLIAQLGARGVSVMFATGDSGPGAICENNAGTKSIFVPAFPATCPFVTAVGATQNIEPEMAASFSGGGFSNYFSQPSYQKSKVSAYLTQLGSKQASYFNASGRGYPDVAAQGVNFLVVEMGLVEPVDGTSCASPTFSSIVALLNSARISSGKKSLGFLNPFLYSKGYNGLTDIVSGGSSGCSEGSSPIPYASWNATTGWDPVTGLGTPNFGKLLAMVAPGVKNTGGVLGSN